MFKNVFFAFLTLSLFACDAEPTDKNNAETPGKRQLAGGWANAEITPDVEQALDFVLMQMNTSAKLDKIVSVKTQIVKGKNFDITFELDNKEQWNCIVYRDIDGKLTMTKVATQVKYP